MNDVIFKEGGGTFTLASEQKTIDSQLLWFSLQWQRLIPEK